MTSEIVFTERAVAFIDILGFKSMVGEAEKESTKLEELVALVNTLKLLARVGYESRVTRGFKGHTRTFIHF